MRNLSDKILPPLCSSLYAHHDKKHLLQHFTTKNLVAEQFYQKTPQISKKTDSQKTVRMGFYYAANPRASQPSRHTFIIA
jgi:hypothetical protein